MNLQETDIITPDLKEGAKYYITSIKNGVVKGQELSSGKEQLLTGEFYHVYNAHGEYDTFEVNKPIKSIIIK